MYMLLYCHMLLNQSDLRPRSEPALELHSRAASSIGVMYRSRGPNTGNNSGGGRILKKTHLIFTPFYKIALIYGRHVKKQFSCWSCWAQELKMFKLVLSIIWGRSHKTMWMWSCTVGNWIMISLVFKWFKTVCSLIVRYLSNVLNSRLIVSYLNGEKFGN